MALRVASMVRRHPQITFFVLAYAVAWAFVPFGSLFVAVLVHEWRPAPHKSDSKRQRRPR